jgi:uncharacterized protein YfaS (alpha-2-macroglobulin family)
MSRRIILISLILFVTLLFCAALTTTYILSNLPKYLSQHETIILGQSQFSPGSQASMRVLVRDSRNGAPLPNSQVNISFKTATGGKSLPLYSGKVNEQGTADILFTLPEIYTGTHTLEIETESSLGSDKVDRQVNLQRPYRLLLTTDKPIYQPGQVVHMRILALNNLDLKPITEEEVVFIISDGKGNKVFRKAMISSEFGVAAADFQLANEINSGNYKIEVALGDVTSEKTVEVKPYVLPKYAIKIKTEQSYYLPGDHVRGTLQADYFFGKPVHSANILINGYTFDVERNDVVNLQGTSDENGAFSFEFSLPDYLVGTDLDKGASRFYLEATVTDLANHQEVSNVSFPVSKSALIIEGIPESGTIRPGIENLFYVLTSYPDGTPAETSLDLIFSPVNRHITEQTDKYGFAQIKVNAISDWEEVVVRAKDTQGHEATKIIELQDIQTGAAVLLRPERPTYRVGEVMNLTILTYQVDGTILLDIVRAGQTVSTRSVDVKNGKANLAIDLTPDLFGTLELHAYQIHPDGNIVRDTRLVAVDNADTLKINFSPDCLISAASQGQDKCAFLPGDPIGLDINVIDSQENGVKSALSLAIVDESVFAISEQDPGFLRLYFLLEKELLEPKYDIHGVSIPDLMTEPLPSEPLSQDPELIQAINGVAFASLAEAIPAKAIFSLVANSHDENIQNASERQTMLFNNFNKFLGITNILLALAVLSLGAVDLWKRGVFWRGLGITLGLSLLFTFLLYVTISQNAYEIAMCLGIVILISLGAAFASFIYLIVRMVKERNLLLGWIIGLCVLFTLFLVFFIGTLSMTNWDSETPVYLGLSALGIMLIALISLLIGIGGKNPGTKGLTTGIIILLVSIFILSCGPQAGNGNTGFNLGFMGLKPMASTQIAPIADETEPQAEIQPKSEAPRLRQYFPETLLWLTDAITDDSGALHLDFKAADSITTWRMTALASSKAGQIGSATGSIRVFQDFFIDLDLPLALTVGDEVSIPVAIYNYLTEVQTVDLELEKMDWFELLDEPNYSLEIAPNDIQVAYFRVRVLDFGNQPFKVTATGSEMSDAIQKEVRVYPNGKQINFSVSDRFDPGSNESIQQAIQFPNDAIPGTQSVVVKIYPGVVSQIVEGLDSMLRMPTGCFEQTSSSTFPNVLILEYLKSSKLISPEVQFKAENYVNAGYQRLLTFEVGNSGGFSLFGDEPADRMLTAFGLQEFSAMSRVHTVDPALIERIANWLLSAQNSDGSWSNDRGLYHETAWKSLENDRLPITAYIVWGLADAGFNKDARTMKSIEYISEHLSQAEDPYVLALIANALVAYDIQTDKNLSANTRQVLDRLAEMAIRDQKVAYWDSSIESYMGGQGSTLRIETTALVALAMLRSGTHFDLANAGNAYLVSQKDSFGTWHSTHATVMTLRSLLQTLKGGAETANATVSISLNGKPVQLVQLTPENFDVIQWISLSDQNLDQENMIDLSMEGEGSLMYQISGSYYLPWEKLEAYPELQGEVEALTIQVEYDRTELIIEDLVAVNVKVTYNQPGTISSALIDLGVPPGFNVQTEDLDALVAASGDAASDSLQPKIERYELAGRQILIYISDLNEKYPLDFTYHLRAKYPLRVQTPSSSAYDYYNPLSMGVDAPQELEVFEK